MNPGTKFLMDQGIIEGLSFEEKTIYIIKNAPKIYFKTAMELKELEEAEKKPKKEKTKGEFQFEANQAWDKYAEELDKIKRGQRKDTTLDELKLKAEQASEKLEEFIKKEEDEKKQKASDLLPKTFARFLFEFKKEWKKH
jgi:hypothetical protein